MRGGRTSVRPHFALARAEQSKTGGLVQLLDVPFEADGLNQTDADRYRVVVFFAGRLPGVAAFGAVLGGGAWTVKTTSGERR
jgi:hypothetical protein